MLLSSFESGYFCPFIFRLIFHIIMASVQPLEEDGDPMDLDTPSYARQVQEQFHDDLMDISNTPPSDQRPHQGSSEVSRPAELGPQNYQRHLTGSPDSRQLWHQPLDNPSQTSLSRRAPRPEPIATQSAFRPMDRESGPFGNRRDRRRRPRNASASADQNRQLQHNTQTHQLHNPQRFGFSGSQRSFGSSASGALRLGGLNHQFRHRPLGIRPLPGLSSSARDTETQVIRNPSSIRDFRDPNISFSGYWPPARAQGAGSSQPSRSPITTVHLPTVYPPLVVVENAWPSSGWGATHQLSEEGQRTGIDPFREIVHEHIPGSWPHSPDHPDIVGMEDADASTGAQVPVMSGALPSTPARRPREIVPISPDATVIPGAYPQMNESPQEVESPEAQGAVVDARSRHWARLTDTLQRVYAAPRGMQPTVETVVRAAANLAGSFKRRAVGLLQRPQRHVAPRRPITTPRANLRALPEEQRRHLRFRRWWRDRGRQPFEIYPFPDVSDMHLFINDSPIQRAPATPVVTTQPTPMHHVPPYGGSQIRDSWRLPPSSFEPYQPSRFVSAEPEPMPARIQRRRVSPASYQTHQPLRFPSAEPGHAIYPEHQPSEPDHAIYPEHQPSAPDHAIEPEDKPSEPDHAIETENKPSVPERAINSKPPTKREPQVGFMRHWRPRSNRIVARRRGVFTSFPLEPLSERVPPLDYNDPNFNIFGPAVSAVNLVRPVPLPIPPGRCESIFAAEWRQMEKERIERERLEQSARILVEGPVVEPLTPQWETRVKDAMLLPNSRKVATTLSGDRLTRKDLATCYTRGEWLNDEVINAYLEVLIDHLRRSNNNAGRLDKPRFHAFSTFFFSNLRDRGYQSVRRWASRAKVGGQDLLNVDSIFVPVHNQAHWTLIVVRPMDRTIEGFDSLGSVCKHHVDLIKTWLEGELGGNFVEEEWKVPTSSGSPQQTNGSDCGIFTLSTAKAVALGVDPLSYAAGDIPLLRMKVVAELMNGGLEGDFAPLEGKL